MRKKENIFVRVSEEEKNIIKVKAQECNATMAEYIRQISLKGGAVCGCKNNADILPKLTLLCDYVNRQEDSSLKTEANKAIMSIWEYISE